MAHRGQAEEGMCAFYQQDTRDKLFVQSSLYKMSGLQAGGRLYLQSTICDTSWLGFSLRRPLVFT